MPSQDQIKHWVLISIPSVLWRLETFLVSARAKHASSRVGGETKQPSFGRVASAHDLAFGSARGVLLITAGSWVGMGSGCDGIDGGCDCAAGSDVVVWLAVPLLLGPVDGSESQLPSDCGDLLDAYSP